MTSGDWSSNEINRTRTYGIAARIDGLVKVGEGAVCVSEVKPVGDCIDEQPSGIWRACSSGPHLPVAFGVRMSVIEWYSKDLRDCGIPIRLHGIDAFRDDPKIQQFIRIGIVEEAVA